MDYIRDHIYERDVRGLLEAFGNSDCSLERDYIIKALEDLIPGINHVDLVGLSEGEFFPNLLHSMSLASRLGNIEALDASWYPALNYPGFVDKFKNGIRVDFEGAVSISYAHYGLLDGTLYSGGYQARREYLTFRYLNDDNIENETVHLEREIDRNVSWWGFKCYGIAKYVIAKNLFIRLKDNIPGFDSWAPVLYQDMVLR